MPEPKNEPLFVKQAVAQPAAKPGAAAARQQERVGGNSVSLAPGSAPAQSQPEESAAPATLPAGELAEIEYFRRSRDTAAEGFKRVRGTRPTGRG